MDLEIVCNNCQKEYADNNLPRTFSNCGHTFCQTCLPSFQQPTSNTKIRLRCPEDNLEIEVSQINELTVNKALLSLVQSKRNNVSTRSVNSLRDQSFNAEKTNKQNHQEEDTKALTITINGLPQLQAISQRKASQVQNELCLLHNKQIEIVCLVDYQRLCSKCALFGQHRGHQFISLDQVQQGNKKIYKSLLNIFDQKSSVLDKLTSKTRKDVLMQKLFSKANQLKKQVSGKFKKIHDQVNKAQHAAYHQLQQIINGIQKKMKKLLVIDDKTAQAYQHWALNAQKKFNYYQSGTHQGLLQFYLSGNGLIQTGKDIVSQLKLQETQSNIEAQKFIQEIGVFFNEEPCLTSLPKIVQFYENDKQYERKMTKAFNEKQNSKLIANCQFYQDIKKRVKTQAHDDDQSLLELVDEFDQNSHSLITAKILDESFPKISQGQQKSTPTKMPKQMHNTTPPSKIVTRKKVTTLQSLTMGIKQTGKQDKVRQQKKQVPISKDAVKKKMRSIKIPQKYQKMLEGVITDTIDAVDFTNAQLGDNITLQICEILKSSTRIKSLKLIRNKITDQGFTKILPLLGGISILNLSQNLLTQNCLNLLSEIRMNLPNLKTIILSQNKIAERKCKGVVEKLRKMDLTISI